MPQIHVRRARTEDVDRIVRLWREMWDFHTPLDPRFEATPAANVVMTGWIEENLSSDRSAVLVAEGPPFSVKAEAGASAGGPGELEGYCLAMILENPPVVPWQFYGYVSEIAVRRHRRGTGGRLLEAAHAWFRERRIPYVEVNVSVKNAIARAFWRKQGYTEFLERLRHQL